MASQVHAPPSKSKQKPRSNERLKPYQSKRRFERTPEPSGTKTEPAREGPLKGQPPRFMIHKHDATRLHYDLRLESDGVLASWAIPKGPSYDPSVKRLAVRTEDHPLEYGGFEGRIPEGEYGAGDSLIWDRGVFETVPPGQLEAQRDKGHVHLALAGSKLEGGWHLVRTRPAGGKEQWLFFKAKDGLERADYEVVEDRPESVVSGRRITRGPLTRKQLEAPHATPEALLERIWPPMRAMLVPGAGVSAARHVFEVKYDGYRALAAISRGRLAFQTRNALDLTGRFPQLARALARLPLSEAVLDGEVVALDAKGASRFQKLGEPGTEHRFVAFDLLWLEGEDLRGRPLRDRRELLESALSNVELPVVLAERVPGSPDEALEIARRRGLEGLLAKAKDSTYRGGPSRDWLKLKLSDSQEGVIVGFAPIKTGEKAIGALLIGVREKRGWRYAGKVGTGFDEATRLSLFRTLETERVESPPVYDPPRMKEVRWVAPRHVAALTFTEWTGDGKMRHPVFHGLREDKPADEVVREDAQRERGPEVRSTHPERVLFPKSGITKADVFDYYRKVAPVMVPALKDRPLAVQMWPRGIHRPGFFRQSAEHVPSWVTTAPVEHSDRVVHHWVVDRPETLLLLANYSALTLHFWSSRVPSLDEPDWVVFDLDPERQQWADLIHLTLVLRGFLEELGLKSIPKTSGKRGLHVMVPIDPGHTHEDALAFAVAVTQMLAAALPDISTTERALSKRGGRIYLDAFQNGRGKTVVAPYSLRALEGAPVSTPLEWKEVTPSLDPTRFNLRTLPRRLDRAGDRFAPVLEGGQRLPLIH